MKTPPISKNEESRLRALKNYEILDSDTEQDFDQITELAAIICDVPISMITLIDENRQWFKSVKGLDEQQTPRSSAFCGYTIMNTGFFIVEDATKDERFVNNPLVTGNPNIRFYAGYPLIDPKGFALGSLCIIDHNPKILTDTQKRALTLLGEQVTKLIVDRRLKQELRNFEKLFTLSNDLLFIGGTDGFFKKVNPAFTRVLGWTEDYLLKTSSFDLIHPDDIENTTAQLVRMTAGNDTMNFLQRIRTSDGGYKTIEWTSSPEMATGNIFGIGRDVSELKLKEQLLSQSEEKLRHFFEGSLGLMFTHDMEGNFLSINNAGAAILGYSREELLKMKLYDILTDERRELLSSYMQRVKDDGQINGQTATRRKDGTVKMWLYNNVLENSNPDKPYVIVNGLDITERDQLEKNLRRTGEMLEQTNQVARVGGWEYDIPKQKIFWTSVTKEIHGVARDYEPDLETGINYYKEGESRERIKEVLNRAFIEGTAWDEELQIINAQGDEIWVRAIGDADFEDGVCKRLFGTFQDIDIYKYGELALKRSLETQEKLNQVMFEHIELIEEQDRTIEKIQEFKFLADSIPEIVWTSNHDGSYDYYNKHWYDYTGMTMEETVENGWAPALHPDDIVNESKLWKESLKTGKPYEAEVRFRRAIDGIYKWHICRAVPMKDNYGKITKWFGSCTDIDEYKRAIDLENRISQFEDFNRIVAHNLRGPAGSISMILDMAAESDDEMEKQELMQMLKQSSSTLNLTLDELMKVLEIRNNQNLPYDICDFDDMVQTIDNMLKGQIIAKHAVISTDFQVPSMKFPRIYLESIFYNMISNALKYSHAEIPPQVKITSAVIDGKLKLTFSDNGIGIDLEKYGNKIFKLNGTFHSGYDSKGVGLFMTKAQIETFGGNISVESTVNAGTKFTIIF